MLSDSLERKWGGGDGRGGGRGGGGGGEGGGRVVGGGGGGGGEGVSDTYITNITITYLITVRDHNYRNNAVGTIASIPIRVCAEDAQAITYSATGQPLLVNHYWPTTTGQPHADMTQVCIALSWCELQDCKVLQSKMPTEPSDQHLVN